MAVKKATTTDDVKNDTTSDVPAAPTHEELVERVVEASDPDMAADVKQVPTVKMKSPWGSVTEVPEGIVDALTDSGYTKSK